MKIAELRERENYDEYLMDTLKSCMLADNNYPGYRQDKVHSWYCHPFFGVYVTHDFCEDGRWYLKRQYQYTPNVRRRLPQAILVDCLYHRRMFNWLLKPAFELVGPEDSSAFMWMPGNHRFRRFDFHARTVRVYPKVLFSSDGIIREVGFRQKYASEYSWILPVLSTNEEHTLVEEALLAAHPLNRDPHSNRYVKFIKSIVNELHCIEESFIDTDDYIGQKRTEFESAKIQFKSRFMGVRFEHVDRVFEDAVHELKHVKNIRVSMTHGDLQPGNILVPDEPMDSVWLIDWEDVGIRASVYDEMTSLLNSRSPAGLKKRTQDFLNSSDTGIFDLGMSRKVALALWTIEEWIWLLEVSSQKGIVHIPSGLCQHFREIA